MSDFKGLIIGIPFVILYFKFAIFPIFKVYDSIPFQKFRDEELTYDFKIKHGILYILMYMWFGVTYIIIDQILKNKDKFSQFNFQELEFNVNQNTIFGLIILGIVFLIYLIIPILFLRYIIKHHFELKKYEFKKHSRLGVELTQFIVGITAVYSFPLGVGVKLGFLILHLLLEPGESKYETSYTFYRDEKGETQIATTYTDKSTGNSQTHWKDSSDDPHIAYKYKIK